MKPTPRRILDSHALPAKLDLRRHFLRAFHAVDPPCVLDCCQGAGVIWETLRKEFALASYWGVDRKPKKGRLAIRSERILEQPGWPYNVVDVDTYGSPWKHWLALLPNVQRPLTVFLTCGFVRVGHNDPILLESLGLAGLNVPAGIDVKLKDVALRYCLARAAEFGVAVSDALGAEAGDAARYIGLRLTPKGGP